MKRFLIYFLLLFISIISCKNNELGKTSIKAFDKSDKTDNKVDVDLTSLSSTMVYAEVFNMIMNPENYDNKIVKMKGQFALFEDMENGKPFYACVIPDATACCLQGFEFVPLPEYNYPKDYPKVDSKITIVGKFEYDENNFGYCRLIDARFIR